MILGVVCYPPKYFRFSMGNKTQCFAFRHQPKSLFRITRFMLFRISHYTCFKNWLISCFILWILATSVDVLSKNGLVSGFGTKFRGFFSFLPITLVEPYTTHGQNTQTHVQYIFSTSCKTFKLSQYILFLCSKD